MPTATAAPVARVLANPRRTKLAVMPAPHRRATVESATRGASGGDSSN